MPRTRTPGPAAVGSDLRQVKAYVPTSKWAEVTDRAARAGLTVSAYLNELIDRDPLDEHGRPTWAPSANDTLLEGHHLKTA